MKRSDGSDQWRRCKSCQEISYRKKWRRGLGLCPLCGHHGRVGPAERLAALVDEGSFEAFEFGVMKDDPLGFVDVIPYAERLRTARVRTGETEAVVAGTARVGGTATVVAVMDFEFLGGSLGTAAGERLTTAAEQALALRVPLVLVTASGGARMQEGALSLLQMAKVSQAMAGLREAGVLTVSIVTDPTYGGVAASFATQSDVILAEPRARLGFAGPRVIRQTINRELPPGFQTAEFLVEKGLIDQVVPRPQLRDTLARLLALTTRRRAAERPRPRPAVPEGDERRDGWQTVQVARDLDRPTARDYIARLCTSFFELHGDRLRADSPTVVGGIGRVAGHPVVIVGTQKGHGTTELVATSFGMAGPDGYRKAQRLFDLAERLRLPVVTLIDTPGANPGIEAEENGQAFAIAESILRLTALRTPVVACVIGEGGSGGALALGVADRVLMCQNAIYSVISPEGCAAILWGPDHAERAAAELRLTAPDLLRLGIADRIVPEPPGGSQADHEAAAAYLEAEIDTAVRTLSDRTPDQLVASRRRRLRLLGAPAGEATHRNDVSVGVG